jgi:hypothetical protein
MKHSQYKIRYEVSLKNKLNNEIVRGNIVNEKDIDGKQYWVMTVPGRGAALLSYSKDSWAITKGR